MPSGTDLQPSERERGIVPSIETPTPPSINEAREKKREMLRDREEQA